MLAVEVLAEDYTEDSNIITGINYVLSEKNKGLNIRVANMSFGGMYGPQADNSPYGTAIKSLSDAGIICVIAAGNNNRNINTSVERFYPACFRFANTISVGSITSSSARSDFSNYGNQWVDIAAPGSDIYSTLPLTDYGYGSEYGTLSGTSMATPHVAGAAALLCAAYPNESASQIKARILSRAKNIGVSNGLWANGTLDVWGAYGTPEITTPSLPGGALGLSYSYTLKANSVEPVAWTTENGNLPNGLNLNGATGEIYGTPNSTGTFYFTVKATNSAGSDAKPLSIVVTTAPVAPIINSASLPNGVIGVPYSQTLNASGTAPIAWSIELGSLPNGLNLNSVTGEIYGAPSSSGTYSFTVRASNNIGAGTKAMSIFIPAPVPVTGVYLNKNTASLHVANNEYLTATVIPTNASDKNVTWSSSNPAVAAVNEYGSVSAVSAGTATITATTVSSGYFDTCQVTVSSYLFHSGSGTQSDPFIIMNATQLSAVNSILDAHYKLGSNIDLTSWFNIGSNRSTPFTGSFDGNGFMVRGLQTSLFGYTFGFGNCTIKNLDVEIAYTGSSSSGLVGYSHSNIENCSVTGGNINAWGQVGGLVGWQEWGEISNCYSTVNVSGGQNVAGLVGVQRGIIKNSYSTGNVNATHYISLAGGLVGSAEGNISNCYATGNVVGSGTSVGGLAGQSGNILNSYATGNVTGDDRVGGLTGGSFGIISNNYAAGNVTASGKNYLGGIMGTPLYNTGNGSVGNINNNYRYQFVTINGAAIPASDPDSGHDQKHGGIVTAAELMSKNTYTNDFTSWLFNDSAPTAGPWYWDNRSFPKLNIGTEYFPFPWDPLGPVITINAQPAPNTAVTQGSISGNLSISASVTQGATLSYQWYRNTTNNNTGGSIETGATNASFTIPTTLTAAGSPYYFYCVVSAWGAVPVHSNAATVTVNEVSVEPTGVTVSPKTLTISPGETYTLQHEVFPSNATDKSVIWYSGNTTVATVYDGIVTGGAPGNASIYVATVTGGFTDRCDVTVSGGEPVIPPGISGPAYMELNLGYEATVSNTFSITGTEPVTVTITSAHPRITWDDANKILYIGAGITPGSYQVVLTASNGMAPNATHTFTLTVTDVLPGSARLYFAPEYITAGVDRTFTITFNVNSEQYNQVECVLAYDPEFLELQAVTQIPPSADWTLVKYSDWGKASFILTPIIGSGAMLNGDNAIATLRFKALKETNGTDISIIQLHGNGAGSSKLQRQTAGIADDIPFTTQGCTVTIVDGVATLKASFQGRSAPGAANIENLVVRWFSGNATIAEETVTTDQNGEADIIIPSPDTGLTIWVKGERTLATSQYIGTVENASVINVGMLPGGDANGDNMVDLNDYNVFLSNYGKSSNTPGFNRFADFNNDGVVDLNDFNIFLSNYGKTGAQIPIWYPSSAMSMMSFTDVSEELSVDESNSDSGCNVGLIGFTLLMPFVSPFFRKKNKRSA
ncbi:MAG: S8 family serine peptidase [Oscillospiraceae bacterium]|nr:S8 family serine peptidase [Oscillospiraceae bacterium]